MKFIILTLLLSIFYNCKAQTIYPLGTQPEQIQGDNYYIRDNDNIHDNFVGTWLWVNGSDSFELTLEEFEQNPIVEGSTELKDRIFGKYKYIENGNILAELTEIPNQIQYSPKVILFYQSTNIFKIQIIDVISEKIKIGEFILNDDGTATMTLQDPLYKSGIRTASDPPPPNIDFQLPTSINLTKIN